MTVSPPPRPWPAWFPAVTRHHYGLAPQVKHPPIRPDGWVVHEWRQFDLWNAWQDAHRKPPRPDVWQHVPGGLWASAGEPGFGPWQLRAELLAARTPPAPPKPPPAVDAAHVDPGPWRGRGVYCAEGDKHDVYQYAPKLDWLAPIGMYWTDDEIARLYEAAPNLHGRVTPWLSWWGDKTFETVAGELARWHAAGYIGECEQPARRDTPARTVIDQENIPQQLDLTGRLLAQGYACALVSDHLELLVDHQGHLPLGRHLHPECYADWVEHAAPGTGVNFRPSTQLRLLARLIDPAHPVAVIPVRGYFAPEPERSVASGWYLEDSAACGFQGEAAWRGDGSMTPDNWRNFGVAS